MTPGFARAIAGAIVAVLTITVWAQSPSSLQGQVPARSQQHGKLFPPEDLGLLDPPDRDIWQKPDQIMDALGIADASIVADFGAGSGFFTVRLARRVGPNGIVYAQDVQLEMVNAISRRVQREGLTNVRTVMGKGNDPNFPRAAMRKLDAILMVGVYHEIEGRVTLLTNLAAALRPQGRIGIIDFRAAGGGPGPAIEERVDPQMVIEDAANAKLRLLSQESFLPYQFFLIFGKVNDASTATRPAAPRSPKQP
jgi:ubiquinone/menaquinone biosynthesis C-methylase UbiE